MIEFKHITKATELPHEWDKLTYSYFQRKVFLIHTEKYNLCKQRYYLSYENNTLISAAIVYSLRLDILTFLKLKSPIKMNIVGVPCSVSSSGIFGDNAVQKLKNYIYSQEKGFLLMLNIKKKPINQKIASGKTLPNIVLKNTFKDWNHYLNSLRSDYRRRLKRIIKNSEQLDFEKLACSEFNLEMHQQYLQVYHRSKGKLEKLSLAFFQNLPSEFILTKCSKNNQLIGWNIALESDNIYYFFLGGIDYQQNKKYNTYLQLLTLILKDGIDKKVEYIDLGQTAEIPKMRLGGKAETLYMEAHHSNSFFNMLLKKFSHTLEYKVNLENSNPLKNESR